VKLGVDGETTRGATETCLHRTKGRYEAATVCTGTCSRDPTSFAIFRWQYHPGAWTVQSIFAMRRHCRVLGAVVMLLATVAREDCLTIEPSDGRAIRLQGQSATGPSPSDVQVARGAHHHTVFSECIKMTGRLLVISSPHRELRPGNTALHLHRAARPCLYPYRCEPCARRQTNTLPLARVCAHSSCHRTITRAQLPNGLAPPWLRSRVRKVLL
jgi:hypothetical protein